MENKKVCNVCGTENEEIYRFCKNCGATLKVQKSHDFYGNQGNPYGGYHNSSDSHYYGEAYTGGIEAIDGVELPKLAAFVGEEKRNYYIPRFISMSLSGKKTSANWIVALLGVLCLPFVGAWFVYRRMYKEGVLAAFIGILISAVSMLMTFEMQYKTFYSTIKLMEKSGTVTSTDELSRAAEATGSLELLNQQLSSLLNIIPLVLIALFANYIYMKFTLRRVKVLNSQGLLISPDDLAAAGRPKAAPAIALGMVSYIICFAIELVPILAVRADLGNEVFISVLRILGGQ